MLIVDSIFENQLERDAKDRLKSMHIDEERNDVNSFEAEIPTLQTIPWTVVPSPTLQVEELSLSG